MIGTWRESEIAPQSRRPSEMGDGEAIPTYSCTMEML